MRRLLSPILVASGLAGLSLTVVAATVGIGATPALAAGKKVCTITDDRLVEISGMLATESGYVVINDSSDSPSAERVFFLDDRCKVDKEVRYGGNGPRDPEDMTLSADDETIWIADTGDNVTSDERRSSVVLWSLPADGSARAVLHRLTYPGGESRDAEALLMADDGTPYIITKSIGPAEIFRPTAPLRKNNAQGVPMEKAGELTLPKTTTANTFGPTGRVTITGAARSPDGTRIALRTYADAFEWDLVDGDIAKTLATGQPRVTALEDPFGESIAYTPDGKTLLTVSDVGSLGDDAAVEILSYPPAQQVAAVAGAEDDEAEAGGSWTDGLTLDDITYLIAAVGILGGLLVGAGLFGILRSRRRPPGEPSGSREAAGDEAGARAGAAAVPPWPAADEPGTPPRGNGPPDGRRSPAGYGGKPGGAVYGSAPAARKPAGGAVYGGGPPAGGGAVYGGGGSRGDVYGADGYRDDGPSTGDGYARDRPEEGHRGQHSGAQGRGRGGPRNHLDNDYGYR